MVTEEILDKNRRQLFKGKNQFPPSFPLLPSQQHSPSPTHCFPRTRFIGNTLLTAKFQPTGENPLEAVKLALEEIAYNISSFDGHRLLVNVGAMLQ